MRKLRPYQQRAAYKISQGGNHALFMEMRLGKTLCILRGLNAYRVLVVCPMVGIWAWKRELEMEDITHVALVGKRQDRLTNVEKPYKYHIINYEGLLSCPDILEKGWGAVILDESRRIANPKAKITRLLSNWSKNYINTRKFILSGNPAPESPLEYFEQMRFLYGSFMRCNNYWQFRNYYFKELAPHEWVPKPGYVTTIKEEIHSKAFVLTRKEAGIKDKKIYSRRVVQLGPEARKTYDKIKTDFLMQWKDKEIKSTKWVPVQYIWLHQVASGFAGEECIDRGKIDALIELMKGELKNEQVVVWFRFNSGLFSVSRTLDKYGIKNHSLFGDVLSKQREQRIDSFRAGNVPVLLCQIKCAKEAIDLSNSSTAIYFTNSHSLDERSQSEDRILNPAKQESLLYIDLVTENTVDEDIVDLLKEKKVESRFFMTRLLEKLKEGSWGGQTKMQNVRRARV